ncbi:MAG TPA: response regulator [Candidatus Methylomirabilis sp.]|nr:response regulator [Candidatus Methylomirabilis sp.]
MSATTRILLVDDEPTILLGLSHLLRRAGAEVISCVSREEAEEAIQRQPFDLALLDVRLSGTETTAGLDLLTVLKKRSPRTYVIIMTAFGTEDIRREAIARGASHYCDKPLNLDHLLGLLRGIPQVPSC